MPCFTQLHIYIFYNKIFNKEMNCSTILQVENRSFLSGNFGASIFLATYIGFYGIGLIIYFTCQFMNDSKDYSDDEIPTEFFKTFHHINDRQDIYSKIEINIK